MADLKKMAFFPLGRGNEVTQLTSRQNDPGVDLHGLLSIFLGEPAARK
jgi:hypothetical protein